MLFIILSCVDFSNLHLESRCLARYDDDVWYRATVVEVGHEDMSIMFDQYEEEHVKLPLEDIFPLGKYQTPELSSSLYPWARKLYNLASQYYCVVSLGWYHFQKATNKLFFINLKAFSAVFFAHSIAQVFCSVKTQGLRIRIPPKA